MVVPLQLKQELAKQFINIMESKIVLTNTIPLEYCKLIEGIFYAWCNINNNKDIALLVGSGTINFNYEHNHSTNTATKLLDRSVLQYMNSVDLTKLIISELNTFKDKSNTVPSEHQINDAVIFELCPERCTMKAKIIKVHFTESKVLYYLTVIATDSYGNDVETRLYNIDSLFVKTLV